MLICKIWFPHNVLNREMFPVFIKQQIFHVDDTDEEDPIVKLSDREYLVLGSTNLEDLCEKLDLDFESDDYDTIGGYLIGLLDHLPEKNEIIITDDDVLLRVEQMDKNRIEKIYIKKPEPKEEA